jgi:hypothetical protein
MKRAEALILQGFRFFCVLKSL